MNMLTSLANFILVFANELSLTLRTVNGVEISFIKRLKSHFLLVGSISALWESLLIYNAQD